MTKPPSDTSTKQARQQHYLKAMFGLNPMWQAPQVLALRRRALGIQPAVKQTTSKSTVELARIRENVKQRVRKIQNEFWSLPLDRLQSQIKAVHNQRVPEFVPTINRLKQTAACRGEFPTIAQAKVMDMGLFRAFKTAVVLPPAEAGYERERFLQSIRDGKRLKKVKKATKFIRTNYPMLYALEKDWFETILAMKKPASTTSTSQRSEFSIELPEIGWGTWILISFALRVLFRILAHSD